jgi:hypothetical protein
MNRDGAMVALSDLKAALQGLNLSGKIWIRHPKIESDFADMGLRIRDQPLFQALFPAGLFLL